MGKSNINAQIIIITIIAENPTSRLSIESIRETMALS